MNDKPKDLPMKAPERLPKGEPEIYPAHVQDSQITPMQLLGARTPEELIDRARNLAKVLKDIIDQAGLSVMIYEQGRPKEYVKIEGWTTLGAMLGVFPQTVWTRREEEPDGNVAFVAHVIVHTMDGRTISSGEMSCSSFEVIKRKRDGMIIKRWLDAKGRPNEFAIRSMSQTRATGKAFRLPFAWILTLAGYEPTPAEEIPDDLPGISQRQDELRTPQGPGFVKKTEPEPIQEVPAPVKEAPVPQLRYFWQIPKEIKDAVDKFAGKPIPVGNPRGVFFERLRKLDPPMTEEEAKYLAAQFYGIPEEKVSFGDKDLDLETAKEKFETLWAVIMYQVDKEAKTEKPQVATNQAEFNKFVSQMHELIPPNHELYAQINKTLFPAGKKLPKYIERVEAVLVILTMNGIDILEDSPMHKWLQERGL